MSRGKKSPLGNNRPANLGSNLRAKKALEEKVYAVKRQEVLDFSSVHLAETAWDDQIAVLDNTMRALSVASPKEVLTVITDQSLQERLNYGGGNIAYLNSALCLLSGRDLYEGSSYSYKPEGAEVEINPLFPDVGNEFYEMAMNVDEEVFKDEKLQLELLEKLQKYWGDDWQALMSRAYQRNLKRNTSGFLRVVPAAKKIDKIIKKKFKENGIKLEKSAWY